MKRFIVLAVLVFPLMLSAQTKLSENAANDFSEKAGARYQVKNDPMMVFITEQMTRSGAGGLEIDKTMAELKKDPAALDAALKFLYQYSDCNRQRLIANLRAMELQNNNVFPLATYVVNKYKGEAKELQEEKATLLRTGMIPAVSATQAAAPPVSTSQAVAAAAAAAPAGAAPAAAAATGTGSTTAAATGTAAPKPAEAAQPPADTRDWDVRKIFQLTSPEQLADLYGKENITTRQAQDFAGNDLGTAYYVYPDTDNEMEVIFSGEKDKMISFTREHSRWKSPFGIKVGDPLEKVVKMNGRNFRINGFEWDNGGTVNSWEGGALDGKGVFIQFKANNSGDPKLYDQVCGDKKVRTDLPVMKKLEVVVEKISFKTYQ